MNKVEKNIIKSEFLSKLKCFVNELNNYVSIKNTYEWTIKGFIDIYKNIYTLSGDTKIISKILEIHIFPKILEFANKNKFILVLAEEQNYYPDISFISKEDEEIKFAVDLKTTYRKNEKEVNGFTLGSHGEYFIDRKSNKNIQYPYNTYIGHYCIGAIYTKNQKSSIDETIVLPLDKLQSITSVVRDFSFFANEKWAIASDKSGSGNTANIGSIKNIDNLVNGKGVFINLCEEWFDEYWINYGKISYINDSGITKIISSLDKFLLYKGRKDLIPEINIGGRDNA